MIRAQNLTKIYKHRTTLDNLKFLLGLSSKSDKDVKAVNNISFEIKDKEIIGIIGPNGAGKTTTIKMLTGLLKPTDGNVKVGKHIPFELKENFKLDIGLFMGEVNTLDDGVVIKDSIEDRLKIYKQSQVNKNKYVEQLVETTGISKFMDNVPENLSQGQRTLVEFVTSILHAPKYLFLDEPIIGLDVNAIIKFKKVIKLLNKKLKSTIIITSHNLQHVVDLSGRIILINKGKILIDKSTDEVIHKDTLDRVIRFYIDSTEGTQNLPKSMKLNFPWVTVKTSKKNLEKAIQDGLRRFKVSDIRITEPPIEEIFSKYFE